MTNESHLVSKYSEDTVLYSYNFWLFSDELDDNLKPIPQAGAIAPLQGRYLGDQDAIRARIEGVKNQTK
jgi:hypothetical protein